MDNPLSNLKLDTWYKGIIAVATVILIVSLTVGNATVSIVAFGFLLIGFGEWINHPTKSMFNPPSAYVPAGILSMSPRDPRPFGLILDAVGAVMIGIGAYRLFDF